MPVRLFSGARGTRVSFHMLHRDDNTRVKQQLYCPADERWWSATRLVKGYEFRKGEYVVIEPEEIKKIEPKTAKTMEILEFVKQEEIDPVYFESSYYLAPDEAAGKPYALLVRPERQRLCGHRQAGHAQPRVHGFSASLRKRPDAAHHVLQGRTARCARILAPSTPA